MGWINSFGYENTSFFKLYLIAIYYIITTITTVGYGDIFTITPIEKIYGVFLEIIGCYIYSFVISFIANHFKLLNDKEEKYKMKMQILDEIKVTYHLNLDLYQQIKVYLKRNILNDKQDNKAFINSLPIFLKNELMSMMSKRS